MSGLTSRQAAVLLAKNGPNQIVTENIISPVAKFFLSFSSPLVILLIIAALVAGALGDRNSAIVIITIIIGSTGLDFANSYKSEKAAEKLKERVKVTTSVLRDGRETEIPLSHVVVGDLILLQPGEIIPADGEIAEADDLFVNESALTGESFPVQKEPGGQALMGTSVISGTAKLLVKTTGAQTRYSKIAKDIAGQPQTEFERDIRSFSFLVIKLTFSLTIFIFLVNALFRHSLLESILFALALAVGLTPELLPMIITLNLTRGAIDMARRGVIVKRLAAIQNFGSMDILCTDKTGTLTEDHIILVKCVDPKGNDSADVFRAAFVSSHFTSKFRGPLDAAIRLAEGDRPTISAYKKIVALPFDFERRRDSVVVEYESKYEIITKGAPEGIIKLCQTIGPKAEELTAARKAQLERTYADLSRDGFRVLAVAIKTVKSKAKYTASDETGLTFLGLSAFLDPPKHSVAETLKIIEKYGISIKILTGDNAQVTQKIAGDIGLPVVGLLSGLEISRMNDRQLAERVESTTIFWRIDPEQKMRIIQTLQKKNHVVGFLGDGINDAPALKAADVGISVANAVDVAKSTADLILLKKSLHDLIDGVIEGRRTFANTMKYLMMSLSANFGNMFSMAGASMILPFLPMLPTQILATNLLTDLPATTISTDNVDNELIARPQKWDLAGLESFMVVFGLTSSLCDFLTFGALIFLLHATPEAFHTGWFLESVLTATLIILVMRTHRPFYDSTPSVWLVLSVLTIVGVTLAIPYTIVGGWLSLTPLPLSFIIILLAILAVYVFAAEVAKQFFYHRAIGATADRSAS